VILLFEFLKIIKQNKIIVNIKIYVYLKNKDIMVFYAIYYLDLTLIKIRFIFKRF